ncbi:MAG TPA: antibiotic biosynthesis monooxygenase [Geminicoccaceae bacterium]|nr:antibiotic biosynthesis monooxygenase [Geminicoccaceae bacterium]
MHAVIFEVLPEPARTHEYLDLAAALRPELERIDGFLSVERFASERTAGKLLSFSLWRDEAALVRWRRHAEHRVVQGRGRAGIFRDYRIRVVEVLGDGADDSRASVAVLEIGPAAADPAVSAAEEGDGPLAREAFGSIYTPGRRLVLTSWADRRGARAWLARAAAAAGGCRPYLMAVERDYGMFDRAGAPEPDPAAAQPATIK